MYLQEKEKLYA
jgi:hypothetical protein